MAPNTKRVKGKRISRAFIIGSEAWPLDDSNRPEGIPADHTTGWRVYVKGIEGGPDITWWLKKVTFKLFHTYPNPNRTYEKPPFCVEETGWGGFQVDIRLWFVADANEKAQWRQHYLQLEPYGTDAEKQAQRDAKMVRSEILDFVEFNEPTEALWEALTDPRQWQGNHDEVMAAATKGGKGGKGKANKATLASGTSSRRNMLSQAMDVDGSEKAAGLPDRPSKTNQWSRQMERALLDLLRQAEKEVEKETENGSAKRKELEEKLEKLRAEEGIVAPVTATAGSGARKR